jgi:hypothetical protein
MPGTKARRIAGNAAGVVGIELLARRRASTFTGRCAAPTGSSRRSG